MMDDERFLRRAFALARAAREHGNHPFGALLVSAAGEILAEAENTVVSERDCTGHAETNLMRAACRAHPPELLAGASLYTSTEPCAMCAGAIYWGGVRRVVFGLRESELYALTGRDRKNPTLKLPCREVFARGQHPVTVVGPLLEDEAREVHTGFWG